MRKLIFGCGYLGRRVAERWRDAGAEVTIVTRSDDKANQLRGEGFQTLVADITRPETLDTLPEAETVLYSVGFDRLAGRSIRQVYAGGMQNVLIRMSKKTERLIYISTTGVYGPARGEWIDERSPTNPQRDGAKASLDAEQRIAAHPLAGRAVVLRLAGLYGPGRVPYEQKLRASQPLAVPSTDWLNLIHVDDAATAVVAADGWGKKGVRNLLCEAPSGPFRQKVPDTFFSANIFCVCDGHPVVRRDYYREVARLLGTPEPRFEPASRSLNSAACGLAVRSRENKRIANKKMQRELGVRPTYPTYHEGLAAILQ